MTDLRDQELADTLGFAADMLRAISDRWRFRIEAGRLGAHTLDETRRMLSSFEEAVQALGREPKTLPAPSEERFRLLVDSVRDYAIFLLAPDGTITSWNAGAERMFGWRAEEMLGKNVSVFYPDENVSAGKPAHDLEIASREGRYIREDWRVRRSGERFWAHITTTALRDGEGRLTGFAKVTHDSSELRTAIEALRQSEERFRLMVEAVRDYAIFMLDPDGHVASWNAGAERLKGYRADEIIGKHFSIFYPDEERVRAHPDYELRRAKAEGRYEEEGWRIRKDGSRFWANVVITAVFDPDGRHLGFTKVTRDFTETRRLREAQIAIQLRDDFLSIAGHELRTPLSALLMQVQSVARGIPADNPRLKQRLDKASASGLRLEKLIDQMLDVSRITAGRLKLDVERMRLDELVREVVERFAELAVESRCPITLRLEPVEGTWDRARIEQVITNLVSNALKYGKGAPIELETRTDGADGILRIVDHGIGIAAEDQAKVFERFERASRTREYGGFGLGLWISRTIAEASGGTLAVTSEAGKGATFTLRVPREARTDVSS